ncbi:hypothetical protein KC19_3G061400 [Ceratodon purpureus]|uniref:Uncharacterized protein n=1 Tax=Ceratodon purpureus TaxID=3225 RepID=A0A8T0II19_CERPU|nr:hypothetical protein KC19_3G061400 [Ceratodon purpureus]
MFLKFPPPSPRPRLRAPPKTSRDPVNTPHRNSQDPTMPEKTVGPTQVQDLQDSLEGSGPHSSRTYTKTQSLSCSPPRTPKTPKTPSRPFQDPLQVSTDAVKTPPVRGRERERERGEEVGKTSDEAHQQQRRRRRSDLARVLPQPSPPRLAPAPFHALPWRCRSPCSPRLEMLVLVHTMVVLSG